MVQAASTTTLLQRLASGQLTCSDVQTVAAANAQDGVTAVEPLAALGEPAWSHKPWVEKGKDLGGVNGVLFSKGLAHEVCCARSTFLTQCPPAVNIMNSNCWNLDK